MVRFLSSEEPATPPDGDMSTGRLRADDRADRRDAILDAALEQLIEHGPAALSMLAVAKRANASKETLYSWFGNKDGVLTALIERNADRTMERIKTAMDDLDIDPRDALAGFAAGLLALLTAEGSVALNRAAMSSPALASRLLDSGRFRVGPIVEGYLGDLHGRGVIDADDAPAAFELLYGLIVRDLQIRILLGEPAPDVEQLERRAHEAVDQFFRLCAPTDRRR